MLATDATSMSLADLSDEAFNDLVNQDVRGTLDPDSALQLRDQANVDRWYDELCSLKRAVEAQLAANRAEQTQKQAEFIQRGTQGHSLWLRHKVSVEKWRQGAIRFKNGVEDRLAEAKRLKHKAHNSTYTNLVVGERNAAIRETARLRRAILDHRTAVEMDKDEPEAIDDHLWATIESDSELQ